MEVTEQQREKDLYQRLWCQCRGDPTAVPTDVLIDRLFEKHHEDAWLTGLIYVSAVVLVYLSTVSFLIYKADRTCSCCSLLSCLKLDQSVKASRRRRQPPSQVLQKEEQLVPSNPPKDPRRQARKLTVPDVLPADRFHQTMKASVKVTVEQPSHGGLEESLGTLHSDC